MLLNFESLCEWTGYQRPSAVRRWLERSGIRYHADAEGNPVTTVDAVNASLRSTTVHLPSWDALERA